MKTYKLGNLGDRVLTVKKRDGQHVATLRIKNVHMKYVELPPKRWAVFRQVVGEVNEAAKSVSNGAEGRYQVTATHWRSLLHKRHDGHSLCGLPQIL